MQKRLLVLLFLGFAGAGCAEDATAPPEVETVLGAIRFYDNPIQITHPDTVEAGAEFTVSVATYGGGCVSQGETTVSLDEAVAVVTPFDLLTIHRTPDAVCTDELRIFTHEGRVRFDSPGQKTIRVRGGELPSGDTLLIERAISVR